MVTADDYLELLIDYLAVSETERNLRMRAFSSLTSALQSRFRQIGEVRMFGSFAKGTSLSMQASPYTDIDVLVGLPKDDFHAVERTGGFFEQLQAFLVGRPGCAFAKICPPCVSVQYEQACFDIFPVLQDANASDSYLFCGPFTVWDAAHQQRVADPRFPLSRSVGVTSAGTGAPTPEKAGMIIAWTNPFVDEKMISEYDRVYGNTWRAFVLLLKYWKEVTLGSLPNDDRRRSGPWSFWLEGAALYALDDHGRSIGTAKPVEFLNRALSRTDLYPDQLLSELPGFRELRLVLDRLCRSGLPGDSPEALHLISSAFPVPGAPTDLASIDPGWFIEAQLVRGSLRGRAGDPEGVIAILTETCDAFQARQEQEIAMPIASALVQKADRLIALGRPDEARACYRSVAERYKSSTIPEVLESVLAALRAEWDLCTESEDSDGALEMCEYTAAAFEGREEADIAELVAASLYNAGVECSRRREHSRGLAFCLAAERRFDGSPLPNVSRIVTAAQFLGGNLAKAKHNPELALRLFTSASQAHPAADDPDTAQTVAWARFEIGDCLLYTYNEDSAALACADLVAQYSSNPDFGEQVACARILCAICAATRDDGAPTNELQELVSYYGESESKPVQRWATIARELLERSEEELDE